MSELMALASSLEAEGTNYDLTGAHLGPIPGTSLDVNKKFDNTTALYYDALWVCDRTRNFMKSGLARRFFLQTFKHFKAIGGSGKGAEFYAAVIESQSELLEGDSEIA